MDEIKVYTDGAYSYTKNVGGWGYVIIIKGSIMTESGHQIKTTSNRMEIQAVLEALRFLHISGYDDRDIHIYSDSKYVVNTINTWLDSWVDKGILDERKNTDLWREFYELRSEGVVAYWVKGHNGDEYNEMADELAVNAILKYLEDNYIEYTDKDVFEYSGVNNTNYNKGYDSKKEKSIFTTDVDISGLSDNKLSLKDKGVLFMARLVSDEDGVFYKNQILKHTKEGVTAISSSLKVLRERGYVDLKKINDKKTGRIRSFYTIV